MTAAWLRRVAYGFLVLFLATIWLVGLIGADDPPYPDRVGTERVLYLPGEMGYHPTP